MRLRCAMTKPVQRIIGGPRVGEAGPRRSRMRALAPIRRPDSNGTRIRAATDHASRARLPPSWPVSSLVMRAHRPATITVLCASLLTGVLGSATTEARTRTRAPALTGLRCVPAARPACRPRPQVQIGRQVQLRGRGLRAGLRVSFRWSRGALATRLRRTTTGFVARVPAGTKAGTVSVRVSDRAGRRSRAIRLVVLPAPLVRPGGGAAALPIAFQGDGMWIWQLPRSSGGDTIAIGAQARAAGID